MKNYNRLEYSSAQVEIIRFGTLDLITTSTASGDDMDGDGWDKV